MPRSCLIRGARIARMLRSRRLIALVSATSASAYPAVCASRARLTARTSARRWSASARGNSRCAARLERLDPLDLAAVWPDAARDGERSERQQKDRKSTRLNSSHGYISYAVFCLKKKIAADVS